jgi:phosphohistidine phosphatase
MAHRFSLYLVRHAIASDKGDAYPDDAARPLTAEGMAKFRKAARGLADLGVEVDRVLTSPLVRARQTADILAAELPGHAPVVETAALQPGVPFERLIEALAGCTDCAAVAIVGHEPGIGDAAARLIGSASAFEFKKGAVCRVDFESWPPRPPGTLHWFLTPKVLKALCG